MAFERMRRFFNETIWAEQLETLPMNKRIGYRGARMTFILVKGFSDERLNQQAAALTYVFFLSIIPFLAVLFGLAKGFGFQDKMQKWVLDLMGPFITHETLINVINTVKDTPATALGAIGFLVLLWTVLKTLLNLERSFNQIWSVNNSRPLYRALSYYLSIVLIVPLLVVGSTTLTALPDWTMIKWLQNLPGMTAIWNTFQEFLPFIMSWVAFSLVYSFMVNTHVRILPAIWGGFTMSLSWNILLWLYIESNIGLSKNKVYGAFAFLPVFLVFLYLSWLLLLFGSRVAFALQNENAFRRNLMARAIGMRYRAAVGLILIQEIALAFSKGKAAPKSVRLAEKLDVSLPLTDEILGRLEQGGIIHRVENNVSGERSQPGVAPNRGLDTILIKEVFNAIEGGDKRIRLPKQAFGEAFQNVLEKAAEARDSALEGLTVKDLI